MALFESILRENFNYMDSELVLEQEAEELGIEPTDDATDEPEYMDEAVTAFCEEMYKLDAAMYIVDVQLESAIVHEGATASKIEPVAENALTDFINRVKEKIIELWHKFQDTVTKIMMKFKAFVSTASGFITKNKSSIIKKIKNNANATDEDKYKYSGYNYEKLISKSGTPLNTASTGATRDVDVNDDPMADLCAEIAKSMGSHDSVSTPSEVVALFQSYCRGTEVSEKTPSVSDVESWIQFNIKGADTLKKIGDAKNKCKRVFDTQIKKLKKEEAKAKKNDKTVRANEIHAQVQFTASTSALIAKLFSAEINLHVEAFKAFASRLRAINNLTDPKKDKEENASSSFASGFDSSLLGDAYDMI